MEKYAGQIRNNPRLRSGSHRALLPRWLTLFQHLCNGLHFGVAFLVFPTETHHHNQGEAETSIFFPNPYKSVSSPGIKQQNFWSMLNNCRVNCFRPDAKKWLLPYPLIRLDQLGMLTFQSLFQEMVFRDKAYFARWMKNHCHH